MEVRSELLTYELTNAVLGWAVIAILLFSVLNHTLTGELLWAGMAVMMITAAIIPPVISRRPTEMIAWEVLLLGALPIVVQSFGFFVGPTSYLAVVTLALIVAVELDAFTTVEMTPEFAVAFVVIVTMAVAGLWTIAQYSSDVYLGTSMLGDQAAVMWDLIIASGIGVIAGVVFELYFRRYSPGHTMAREPWGKSQ
jgi:hypothetical protein